MKRLKEVNFTEMGWFEGIHVTMKRLKEVNFSEMGWFEGANL